MEFELSQNLSVDSLDKVPEHFRPLYVQGQDGKLAIPDSMKPVAGAIDGLNKANKTVRRDLDTVRKNTPDLKPWKSVGTILGLDPEELTPDALQAAVEDLHTRANSGDKSAKVNLDKLKKEMQEANRKALEAKDGELNGMRGSLSKYLIDNAAISAISELKGVPELLLPHVRAAAKVVQDGNDYVVRVVDAQGDPRGDGKGGFMTVKDLVAELKASATFGRAFESQAPAGGGKPPAKPGSRAPAGPQQGAERSATQKIADGLRSQAR
jgi:hypothetical protein